MAPLRIKTAFSGNVRVCGEPSHQHRILTDTLDGNVTIVGKSLSPTRSTLMAYRWALAPFTMSTISPVVMW